MSRMLFLALIVAAGCADADDATNSTTDPSADTDTSSDDTDGADDDTDLPVPAEAVDIPNHSFENGALDPGDAAVLFDTETLDEEGVGYGFRGWSAGTGASVVVAHPDDSALDDVSPLGAPADGNQAAVLGLGAPGEALVLTEGLGLSDYDDDFTLRVALAALRGVDAPSRVEIFVRYGGWPAYRERITLGAPGAFTDHAFRFRTPALYAERDLQVGVRAEGEESTVLVDNLRLEVRRGSAPIPADADLLNLSFEWPTLDEGQYTFAVPGWQRSATGPFAGVVRHADDVVAAPPDGDQMVEISQNVVLTSGPLMAIEQGKVYRVSVDTATRAGIDTFEVQTELILQLQDDVEIFLAPSPPVTPEAAWSTLTACYVGDGAYAGESARLRLKANTHSGWTGLYRAVFDDVRVEVFDEGEASCE